MRRKWVVWQDNDEPVRQPMRICCCTASTSPVNQSWGQLGRPQPSTTRTLSRPLTGLNCHCKGRLVRNRDQRNVVWPNYLLSCRQTRASRVLRLLLANRIRACRHNLITDRSLCLSFAVLCSRFNCSVTMEWVQGPSEAPNALPRPTLGAL